MGRFASFIKSTKIDIRKFTPPFLWEVGGSGGPPGGVKGEGISSTMEVYRGMLKISSKMNARRPEDGPRWPQHGYKMVPRWPKMIRRWTKMAPRGPKMAQDGPKTVTRWAHQRPKDYQE